MSESATVRDRDARLAEVTKMLGWALDWIADTGEIPLADEEPECRLKWDRATDAVKDNRRFTTEHASERLARPKEDPAAAVLVSREDLASLLNNYDRPANDVTRRLRRAVIESEDAARASVSVTENTE